MKGNNGAGRFKIEVRHEGYHSSHFTRGTQINHGYLIGKGPLSTKSAADQIAYDIVQQVIEGKSISDALLANYSDPLPDTQRIPSTCTATAVNKSTFKEYNADAEFDLYFWRYEDAQISRGGCSPSGSIHRPSRRQFLEMADEVEDEFGRKQSGIRQRDYQRRTMYRPPFDGLDFIPAAEGKDTFTELFDTEWAERVLSFTNSIECGPSVWDIEVILPSDRTLSDNWAHRTPAISWTYTGEIADYYGSERRPGFTVSGIPPREEFLVETTDHYLADGEKEALPIDRFGGGEWIGSSRSGADGQSYATRSQLSVFISSDEAAESVLQWFVDELPEKLENRVIRQVLTTCDGVGEKRRSTVENTYDSVWEFFETDVNELKIHKGIGPQTAQTIQDTIEERKAIAGE